MALSLAACAAQVDDPAGIHGDAPAIADDPVAMVAHGAFYDEHGATIEPDRELVRSAQAYYLARLEAMADESTRAQLAEVRERLAVDVSEEEQAYLDKMLIQWLASTIESEEASDLLGKSLALYNAYERLTLQPGVPIDETRRELEAGVRHLVHGAGIAPGSARAIPGTYLEHCRNARVPIPPKWGDARWKFSGSLADNQEFILVNEGSALVYYYESTSPKGVCMALPRLSTAPGEEGLYTALGIICHGVETSKACFWDAANVPILPATKEIATFTQGNVTAIKDGGKCTDCHAGSNPFIIHPDTALNVRSKLTDVTNWDSKNWVDPLIHNDLPQNPGPTNVLLGKPVAEANSCSSGSCHSKEKQRQLPEMYAGAQWCAIAKTAMEGRPITPVPGQPSIPAAPKTMPPAGIGGNFTTHIAAVKARCTQSWTKLCSPDNAKICAQAGGYCERAVSTTNFRTDICRWPGVATKATCENTLGGYWVTADHPQQASWPSWRVPVYMPAGTLPVDSCVRQMTTMGGNVGGVVQPAPANDTILRTCSGDDRDKCRARGGSCELHKNTTTGATDKLCRWPTAKNQTECNTQAGLSKWRAVGTAWFTTYPTALRGTVAQCMEKP